MEIFLGQISYKSWIILQGDIKTIFNTIYLIKCSSSFIVSTTLLNNSEIVPSDNLWVLRILYGLQPFSLKSLLIVDRIESTLAAIWEVVRTSLLVARLQIITSLSSRASLEAVLLKIVNEVMNWRWYRPVEKSVNKSHL